MSIPHGHYCSGGDKFRRIKGGQVVELEWPFGYSERNDGSEIVVTDHEEAALCRVIEVMAGDRGPNTIVYVSLIRTIPQRELMEEHIQLKHDLM